MNDAPDEPDETAETESQRADGNTARARSVEASDVVYINDPAAIEAVRRGQEALHDAIGDVKDELHVSVSGVKDELHGSLDLFSSRIAAAIGEQARTIGGAMEFQATTYAKASSDQARLGLKITGVIVVAMGVFFVGVAVVASVLMRQPISATLPGHIGVSTMAATNTSHAPAEPPTEDAAYLDVSADGHRSDDSPAPAAPPPEP